MYQVIVSDPSDEYTPLGENNSFIPELDPTSLQYKRSLLKVFLANNLYFLVLFRALKLNGAVIPCFNVSFISKTHRPKW